MISPLCDQHMRYLPLSHVPLRIDEILTHAVSSFHPQNKPSVIYPKANIAQTYEEFNRRVDIFASWLRKRMDFGKGQRVVVVMDENDIYLVYLFAVARAGLIFVPMNTRLTIEELRRNFDSCEPVAIVFDDRHRNKVLKAVEGSLLSCSCSPLLVHVPECREKTLNPPGIVCHFGIERETGYQTAVDGMKGVIVSETNGKRDLHVGVNTYQHWGDIIDDDWCALFYTSGTTAASRAVILSHRSLITQARAKLTHVGYSTSTTYLHLAPLFHVGGTSSALAVVLAGGSHIITGGKFNASEALDNIKTYAVDTLVVVPPMLRDLVDVAKRRNSRVDGIRIILCGGGSMRDDLLKEAREVFQHAKLVETYAMTEAASSLGFRCWNANSSWRRRCVGKAEHGYKSPSHVKVAIAEKTSEETRIVSQSNVMGEILSTGPHIMSGYWRNAPATRDAFIRDGVKGNKWLRTGDFGYIGTDGLLYVKGRIKDMIKSGGENVLASEVESMLIVHPKVREAAVFGVEHRFLGEAVVGAIRCVGDMANGDREAEVRRWCRRRMSSFKIPKRLWTVQQLPRNSMGKVNKISLRDMLRSEIEIFVANENARYRKRWYQSQFYGRARL